MTPLYPCTLSQAEKDVLELSNKGKTPQEIADERDRKKHTIENQLLNARKKVKKCEETLKDV